MVTGDFLNRLCEALAREPGSITLDDTPETIPEWDSVGHLAILATIDSALGLATDSEEMRNFTSIRQLVELLKTKGALED
jgi:acyl carrier protein